MHDIEALLEQTETSLNQAIENVVQAIDDDLSTITKPKQGVPWWIKDPAFAVMATDVLEKAKASLEEIDIFAAYARKRAKELYGGS